MALQTDNLVMVGLGMKNDQPANSIQPPLADGIHLRWAFKRELGFPWYGYSLFRRNHSSGDYRFLSTPLASLPIPFQLGLSLLIPFGSSFNAEVSSDSSLALEEDFPFQQSSSVPVVQHPEFGLNNRGYIRITFPNDEPARKVKVYVGFTGASAEIHVKALYKGKLVGKEIVGGQAGDIRIIEIEYEMISAVELSSGPASLVDLGFVPVSDDATSPHWVPLFSSPLCLTVAHPNYPCPGAPSTKTDAETMALKRIRYGSQNVWHGDNFSALFDQLSEMVKDGPLGATTMAQQQSAPVQGTPTLPGSGGTPPKLTGQYHLNLVLLGALHPAVAQMVGLYWVDETAQEGFFYDYLLVANHKTPNWTLLDGFEDVDAFIAFNLQKQPAVPLSPPVGLRTYALPGAENSVGLCWDISKPTLMSSEIRLPMMYNLWRAGLGNGENPTTPTNYKLITKYGAVLVVNPAKPSGKTIQPPDNWPPERLHYLDTGLADGWYSYQVSGVDIFGRHSQNSPPGPWLQWTPAPKPKPWYYIEPPPTNLEVHPSAVRMRDTMPPPPPTGIEAYALDPQDPTVLKDAAYTSWWNALTASQWYEKELTKEQKEELIGLRVRWRWTHAHAQQAPDTHEFRIYFHPDPMNVLVGKIVSVTAVSAKESDVEISVNTPLSSNAYQGLWLQVGNDAFKVISIQSGNPLRLRVENIGTDDEITPQVNMPFSLVIPLRHKENYPNGHPDFVDYSIATNWNQRYHVVDYNAHFKQLSGAAAVISGSTVTLDGDPNLLDGQLVGELLFLANDTSRVDKTFSIKTIDKAAKTATVDGTPNTGGVASAWRISLRTYEIFLPTADGRFKTGAPLKTSLADPIAYGFIGVSAADDKTYTPDKRTTGDLANRTGNEGPVGAPAKIFRVHRKPPDPPALPLTDSDKVYATSADYHNRSFYTFRWVPIPNVKTHIFRALDESLFKLDWLIRTTRAALNPILPWHKEYFPDTDPEDRSPWGLQRKQAAASQLNAITSLTSYSGLSNDARKLLARLPGNEGTKWDNGLQQRDWEVRASRKSLIPGDNKYFPGGWNDPRREPDVAATLNALTLLLTGTAATTDNDVVALDGTPDLTLVQPYWDRVWLEGDAEQPDGIYRIIAVDAAAHTVTLDGVPALTGSASAWAIYLDPYQTLKKTNQDALRVLAGLPGNERAFSQVTIQRLDPDDPANANRRGPNDPDNFVPGDPNNPLAAITLRAYEDTLDGRSSNAYFYRAGSVDGAHNRSEQLSLSSPPVYCPDVTPPQQVQVNKVLGGEDKITVVFAPNRETDLARYRVYRAETEADAADIRLMVVVGLIPKDVMANEIRFVDDANSGDPKPGKNYYYRVTAVDAEGNESFPSAMLVGRCYRSAPPAPPRLEAVRIQPNRVELNWTGGDSGVSLILLWRTVPSGMWQPLTAWTERSTLGASFATTKTVPDITYRFKLKVMDRNRHTSESNEVET